MAVCIPMESNPDTINQYLQKLGVSSKWRVVDVLGLEGEPLTWVPRPVLAVIFLFPTPEAHEQNGQKNQEKDAKDQGMEISKNVFHLRQIASTVCGTVALVHGIANNADVIELSDGPLKDYLKGAENLDAEGKGILLERSQSIFDMYNEIVREQSRSDEEVAASGHFVTFIHKEGALYELDGRRVCPVRHGPTSPNTLLEDAARVCRRMVDRDPENIAFTIIALVAAP